MKDVENKVKDKTLFYWLDAEITLIHIYLYWIGAAVVRQTWAWWAAGVLTVLSLRYMGKIVKKLRSSDTWGRE